VRGWYGPGTWLTDWTVNLPYVDCAPNGEIICKDTTRISFQGSEIRKATAGFHSPFTLFRVVCQDDRGFFTGSYFFDTGSLPFPL